MKCLKGNNNKKKNTTTIKLLKKKKKALTWYKVTETEEEGIVTKDTQQKWIEK